MTGEPVRLWQKIFLLSDELRNLCNDVHSPKQVKVFFEMTLSQVNLIKKIKVLTVAEPSGIGLKALAQELEVSAAAVSEQINVLVKKGLVVREPCQTDRRAVRIKLSGYMTGVINKVEEYLDLKTAEFMREVKTEDAAVLDAMLDRLLVKMKRDKSR